MKKDRANTKIVLIDIQYHESLNFFEYQYGEFMTYKEMEQRSYIDFKEIMFNKICNDIKFRKFGRFGKILTIKAEMQKNEIEQLKDLLEQDKISIGYGWIISNVTLIKDNKLIDKENKYKKIKSQNENEDEEDDIDEDDLENELDEQFDEF